MLSLQSQENGPQAHQRRVERRTEKLGVWKQKTRSSEQGLMPWERRKECKEDRASRPEKEKESEDVWRESMEVEDEAESQQEKKLTVVFFQRYAGEYQEVIAAPVARGGEKEA